MADTYWTLHKAPPSSPKKWAVRVPTSSGRGKTVLFGARGYEDFTTHGDVERRERYRIRHQHDRIDDPYAPGFWSMWALWGESDDLKTAFAAAVRKAKSALGQARRNPSVGGSLGAMTHSAVPSREVPLLEEEVDLQDPDSLHGLYAVESRAPAYPLSVLAVDAGYATIVGEHELADGSFMRVLRFGRGRANPEGGTAPDDELRTVRLGPEFFQAPLKEYSEWPLKWWREVVQNSVDAGCSYMKLGTRNNDDGTVTVYAEDNGRGMDRDTLLDKFLVLGATTKVGAAGKTGGFGKAKELILLPWLGWRIHTRDLEAVGNGADYRVRSAPRLNGTRIEATMSADACTTLPAAKEFLSRCNIPQVEFELINENDPDQNTTMNPISDVSTMTMIGEGSRFLAYYQEQTGRQRYYAWVRINGLFMFEIYVGTLPGQIVVELQGSSLDILHSNRDSLRDRSVQREVSELQEKLAKDTASALRSSKGHVRKKWVQGDKFRAPRLSSPTYLPVDVMKQTDEGKFELSTGALDAIVGEYQQEVVRNEEASERQAKTDLARDQLQNIAFGGDRHLEAALKQLAWKPDFILVSEVDNFKVPDRFTPEKMNVRVKRLLAVWAECCRWVLMQLGCASEYSVGFCFSRNASAQFMREDGENWLLLNPFASRAGLSILDDIHYYSGQKSKEKELLGTMFQVMQRSDFQWLYSLAVHECTHFADDVMYHDEAFSSAMTVNFARCADGMKQYRRILDATKGGRIAGDD